MARLTRDPLLAVAAAVLWFFIGLFAIAMVIVAVGVGALLVIGPAEVAEAFAKAGTTEVSYWMLVGGICLLEPLLFVMLRFCLELRGVVRSVDQGDPFHPDNARRLSRMGWLSLAGWVLALAVGMTVGRLAGALAENPDVESGFYGSVDGVLLALVLFILARVFRQGAAMREDLEGTV